METAELYAMVVIKVGNISTQNIHFKNWCVASNGLEKGEKTEREEAVDATLPSNERNFEATSESYTVQIATRPNSMHVFKLRVTWSVLL